MTLIQQFIRFLSFQPEVFDDLDMMTQRVRNVLAYGTTPIIVYIDAIDLVRILNIT